MRKVPGEGRRHMTMFGHPANFRGVSFEGHWEAGLIRCPFVLSPVEDLRVCRKS